MALVGGLGSLRSLSLSGNGLSGLVPDVLGDMAALESLNLDENMFAWPPPANLVSPRPGLLVFYSALGRWAPAAPANVAAVGRVDALEVAWDAPAAGEPEVSSYRLRYRPAGTTGPYAVLDTAALSARVEGLAGGVVYELAVTGSNHNGAGAESAAVSAAPLGSPCALSAVVDQALGALVADCDALWAQRRALSDAAALVRAPAGAWGDQNPITAWRGVTVTAGRVTELDLSGLGLAGPPAPELGALGALTGLDLSNNSLSGPIPAELGNLGALVELDLSSNMLSGPIPAQLASLNSLEVLDLSLNSLSGPVPAQIAGLGSLRVLDLAGNDLSGPIPTQLAQIGSLEVLRISGPGLSGPIPAGLGGLGSLTELHIDGGQLSGQIPTELGALSGLTRLHIGGGSLTGTIPTQLANLAQLQSLYISGPNISGPLPPQLGALTGLQTLWIKSQDLTGTVPARYASLTGLHTLYVSGGALTGPVPPWITSLNALQRLYLHDNALTGPIPAGLASMSALTTIWLAHNNLTGAIPAALAAMPALTVLDLRHNPLTWPPPAGLADPAAGLTALLPHTDDWAPPPPTNITAEAQDGALEVSWEHPGAGTDFQVDSYTINHRPHNSTGAFTQTAAATSPATVSGLANNSAYDIFVTATNAAGTSTPTTTITATPDASARAPRYHIYGAIDDVGVHDTAIVALHGWRIFAGTDCANNRFCPTQAILRWKLAVWLVRALDRGQNIPAPAAGFTDLGTVPTQWHRHINRLHNLGVTVGCSQTPLRYCPTRSVTRAQMASFLVRAFDIDDAYPDAGPAGFTDVSPTSAHYDNINALYASGVTVGCGPPDPPLTFCPDQATSHAQMATFIHRACEHINTIIGRPCDPIPPPPPPGPPAPTIDDIAPGPGTLTIKWRHGNGSPPGTRPVATNWEIRHRRFINITNPQGNVTRHYFPYAPTLPVTDPAAASTGFTIEALEFDSHYAVEIRGIAQNGTTGNYSTQTEAKTDPAAVKLVALEITQGLQNWNGDITLVKGKPTVVRAFLEPLSGISTTVNVRLYAQRAGQEYKAIGLANPDKHQGGSPSHLNRNQYTAYPDASEDRDILDASANFILTQPNWIGNYLDEGEDDPYVVTYSIMVDEGAVCLESIDQNIECGTRVSFNQIDAPQVRIFAVETVNGIPSHLELEEQRLRIVSMMPIPDLVRLDGAIYPVLQDDDLVEPIFAPTPYDVNTVLIDRKSTDSYAGVYMGIMSGFEILRAITGSGNGVAGVASWYIFGAADQSEGGLYRNTGSHEFGHVLGERHASLSLYGRYYEVCYGAEQETGIEGLDDPVRYEYVENDLSTYSFTGSPIRLALLGRQGDPDQEFWGLDTRFMFNSDSPLAVVDPHNTFSVMSYCDGIDDSQGHWVDGFFHERFIHRLEDFNWYGFSAGAVTTPQEVLIISGRRTEIADSSVEVDVSPMYTVRTTSTPPEVLSGPMRLELLDATGGVMRSAIIEVPRLGANAHRINTRTVSDASEVQDLWLVAVVDPPEFDRYRIVEGSTVVAEGSASSTAPTVTVMAPVPADGGGGTARSSEDTVRLSWSGADVDGDDLTYRVQYSTDGGANYRTVATGVDSDSLVLDRDQLAGSNRARFRVIASDGIKSTSAESPLFIVAPHRPRVFIHNPTTTRSYGPGAMIALSASAYDAEEGSLSDSAITWTSDIDGHLAVGSFALLVADDLSVGTHRLTATATDDSAMSASASLQIVLRDSNSSPDPHDDFAYSRIGKALLFDVLANDIDTEHDILAHSLRVLARPALGTAERVRSSTATRVIRYESREAGYDAFFYEICDQARQCSLAEAVVASMP